MSAPDLWAQKFALGSAIAFRRLHSIEHFALLCAIISTEVIAAVEHSSLPADATARQLATKLRRDCEALLIAHVLPQAVPSRWRLLARRLREGRTNMPPPGP